ncbi:MAG TPA: hypothetical protein DCZ03_15925 [Gammaproteobacteria bacterium]|nr:hypothetical protein [Gammaproteobacteria bacterium]
MYEKDQLPSPDEFARIRWACRRGMLELDLFLLPFFENDYQNLDKHKQQTFIQLLSCDDPDLFVWLMGKSPPPQKYTLIIEDIRAATQNRDPTL